MSILYIFTMADLLSIFCSIFVVYFLYSIIVLYKNVSIMPPGPIPLPFIGNILCFREVSHWSDLIEKCVKQYGPIITLWIGPEPYVFIADIDIAKNTFNKPHFNGRIRGHLASVLSNKDHQDVGMTDYGTIWHTLRKVVHCAIVKFSKNDNLEHLVCGCVDPIITTIVAKEGVNKEFNPFEYNYSFFLNISASIAFGRLLSTQDEIIKKTKTVFKEPSEELGARFLLWELSSLARLLDWRAVRRHRKQLFSFNDLIKDLFKSHYKEYNSSMDRDFCDALISAKNDALREGKRYASHLNDDNLATCITDLFLAGIEATQITLNWIFLLISYYPEIQKKLRNEIKSQIGDRIPTKEDREGCHYVMAVISETLRWKTPAAVGIPHKAMVASKIGNFTIPKGTAVLVNQRLILIDENHWPNGHEFRPERFLENGEHINNQNKAYIPFSVGRRVCPGESLAIPYIFLVLVRFIQLTADYEIVLGENNGLDGNPKIPNFYSPKEFKILLKKIQIIESITSLNFSKSQ